jgi:hypothetical protein
MKDFPNDQRRLWTVHRNGRVAAAAIRRYSFGRELRITVGAETVFRRLLGDGEHEGGLSAATLQTFLGEGWTPVPPS